MFMCYDLIKKNRLSDKETLATKPQQDTKETQVDIAKWKKPIWKAMGCRHPTLWHSGKGRTGESK